MLQLTVHFRPRYSVRSCYFLYTAGPGVLYGRLRVSCQLNPLSPSAVAGIFNPRFTEGWMFGLFEVRRWVSYGFLKIKLIRVVTSEYLTVTLYCLRGHTYTARGNGWTPPPRPPSPLLFPFTTVAVLIVQIVFVENKLFFTKLRFTEGLLVSRDCVLVAWWYRVIQGDGVDVWTQLNVLLLRFFWVSVVFHTSYVFVVKLLATLLWSVCYLCFPQR